MLNGLRMNFLNTPNFKDGENITVRLGSRWFGEAVVDDILLLYNTDDNDDEVKPIAKARVIKTQYKSFLDVTTGELRKICCAGGNTPEGLAWDLLECYPHEFNLDSDVTLVHFELLPDEESEEDGV